MQQARGWTEMFRNRVKERWWDVRDWIDFRPDPTWWVAAILIGVLVAGAFSLPLLVVGVILAASIAFAVALIAVTAVGMVAAIGLQALVDVMKNQRPARPVVPIHRVGPMAKSR